MLHVLRFVHANGQLDSEIAVGTTFGHGHLVKLGLLWTVGGWMQHDLQRNTRVMLEELLRNFGQRRRRYTAVWKWFLLLFFSSWCSSPFPAPCPPEPTLLCSQWIVSPWQLAEAGWWWNLPGSPSWRHAQEQMMLQLHWACKTSNTRESFQKQSLSHILSEKFFSRCQWVCAWLCVVVGLPL